MLEFILVRHGETEGSRQGVFYGKRDYSLTDKGLEQAKRTAALIRECSPAAIYSSPLTRTVQTAEVIAGHHQNIKVTYQEALSEMDFGFWEGLNHQEIALRFPQEWETWCRDSWNMQVPGGESGAILHKRVVKCIQEIRESHGEGQVVIISHHGCLRSIISYLLGFGEEGYWHFKVNPGCVTRIETAGGFGVMTLFNG